MSSTELAELGQRAEQAHLSISSYVRLSLFGRKSKATQDRRPSPRTQKPAALLPSATYCPKTDDHAHRFRPISQMMMGGGELRTCNWCDWKEVLEWEAPLK